MPRAAKVTNRAGTTATGTTTALITAAPEVKFYLEQAWSDEARSTTLAFSGFGMMTGGLGAQSFFPPGKVADYWGFQYLRDNDADDTGHNTSFLTRVSSNILYILTDALLERLKSLAIEQVDDINLYAWNRYPLMKAFRRLLDGTVPAGTTGLSVDALKAALAALRTKVMTVTYADGSTIDYSALNKFYLYASELSPTSADLVFYTSDASTDQFFKRF